jgi:hypothetical protein
LPIVLLEKELQKSLDSFKGSVELHQREHDRSDVLRIDRLHATNRAVAWRGAKVAGLDGFRCFLKL